MPVLLRYKDQDIIDGLDQTINPSLYGHYSASFRRAVDVTFKQDSDSGLSDRLRANAARFAAHKAAYVQRTLQNIQADPQIEDKPKACKQALRVFDNWQDAEYNTAVARARTAKQFEEFKDPEAVRLFPNLRWVPSRSANPRATHVAFYDKVWAKGDAFWDNHAPGTEWNCKCDIEETDDPVTDNSGVPLPEVPKGLEGNPYDTGELFTDKASYVAKTIGSKPIMKAMEECTYPDRQDGLSISVLAHREELVQNIETGRILASNGNDVVVMPHVNDGRKNPEYSINGEVADAKRIETEKGVTAGFKSALDQKCTVVVIDLNRHLTNRVPKWGELAKRINWRRTDLDNGVSCMVVYGKKSVTITSRHLTKDSIQKELETLKP